MATLAYQQTKPVGRDDRFFRNTAFAMALTVVAGFSLQHLAGRSSFHAPPLVHAHAIVFMGWVAIYVAQAVLAANGSLALHRRLGWIAAGWMVAMLVLGITVTVVMVRAGHAPFFFLPAQFLVFNPLSLIVFVGLTVAAIVMRRRTAWHRRLHYCGMAMLLGPAFGRLLPAPLLIPYAFEATFVATMIFPIIGVVADLRRTGRVHPAWGWGIGAMVAFLIVVEGATHSQVGAAFHRAVTAGSPAAGIDPNAFPPPPAGPLITGT